MERLVGTVSRGVRAPIIRQGDDLADVYKRQVWPYSGCPGVREPS